MKVFIIRFHRIFGKILVFIAVLFYGIIRLLPYLFKFGFPQQFKPNLWTQFSTSNLKLIFSTFEGYPLLPWADRVFLTLLKNLFLPNNFTTLNPIVHITNLCYQIDPQICSASKSIVFNIFRELYAKDLSFENIYEQMTACERSYYNVLSGNLFHGIQAFLIFR